MPNTCVVNKNEIPLQCSDDHLKLLNALQSSLRASRSLLSLINSNFTLFALQGN